MVAARLGCGWHEGGRSRGAPGTPEAARTARLQAVIAAVERLLQVGEDILDRLEPDAQAHEAVLQGARVGVRLGLGLALG